MIKRVFAGFIVILISSFLFSETNNFQVYIESFQTADWNNVKEAQAFTGVFTAELSKSKYFSVSENINSPYKISGVVTKLENSSNKTVYYNSSEERNFGFNRQTKTERATETETVCQYEVTIKMIEIGTQNVIAGGHIGINNFAEFQNSVQSLVQQLEQNILKENTQKSIYFDNNGCPLGTWTCEVFANKTEDIYQFSFDGNGKVDVKITSTSSKGNITTASGSGRYVYSPKDKVFAITIRRLSGDIKHIKKIDWKTSIIHGENDGVFYCSVPDSSEAGYTMTRAEWYYGE